MFLHRNPTVDPVKSFAQVNSPFLPFCMSVTVSPALRGTLTTLLGARSHSLWRTAWKCEWQRNVFLLCYQILQNNDFPVLKISHAWVKRLNQKIRSIWCIMLNLNYYAVKVHIGYFWVLNASAEVIVIPEYEWDCPYSLALGWDSASFPGRAQCISEVFFQFIVNGTCATQYHPQGINENGTFIAPIGSAFLQNCINILNKTLRNAHTL